jgi:hypothetical protein
VTLDLPPVGEVVGPLVKIIHHFSSLSLSLPLLDTLASTLLSSSGCTDDAVRLGEAAVTLFQVAAKPESPMEEQLYESKKTRCAMPHI